MTASLINSTVREQLPKNDQPMRVSEESIGTSRVRF